MFEHRCSCGQRRVSLRRVGQDCPSCYRVMRVREITPPKKRPKARCLRMWRRILRWLRLSR
jgi:hypothetical protein